MEILRGLEYMINVALDDLNFTVFNFEEDTKVSKPTGNTIRYYKFNLRYQGLQLKDQLSDVLKKPSFAFKILGGPEPIEMRASGSQSYSYTGSNGLLEDTIITASVTIEELDKDLPEDHSFFAALGEVAIMNWVRTRALSSLMIKKGIFTNDEYITEITEIRERDFENLRKLISYGIPEPERD
jgi:hypothetical protein